MHYVQRSRYIYESFYLFENYDVDITSFYISSHFVNESLSKSWITSRIIVILFKVFDFFPMYNLTFFFLQKYKCGNAGLIQKIAFDVKTKKKVYGK